MFRFRSLLRLPSLARLSIRLLQDRRISVNNKAAAIGAIALIISPLDLPGWIPIIGQGFDIILIVKVLDLFIGAAPQYVVQEHIAALGLERSFNV